MSLSSHIRRICAGVLPLVAGIVLSGCDGMIYDQEGDCSVTYRVRFRYDRNLKFADAFAAEVESVTLYALDTEGRVVWQRTEQGEALREEGYAMDVDIAPGTYDLVAWCGSTQKGSFAIEASPAVREDLACTLRRTREESGACVREDLDRLYHGYLPACRFDATEGVHTYTVPLTKDTNNIRVVLQQLSGDPIDETKFSFFITACNGSMEWNNELLPDERITYHAWHVRPGSAGLQTPGSETIGSVNALIAELTTARLMERDKTPALRTPLDKAFADGDRMRLRIVNNDTQRTVVDIPLVDYALLVKGEYRHDMDDQEFLDRMDEYNLVFVLDSGYRWVSMSVNINSWKLVWQNSGI